MPRRMRRRTARRPQTRESDSSVSSSISSECLQFTPKLGRRKRKSASVGTPNNYYLRNRLQQNFDDGVELRRSERIKIKQSQTEVYSKVEMEPIMQVIEDIRENRSLENKLRFLKYLGLQALNDTISSPLISTRNGPYYMESVSGDEGDRYNNEDF